MSNYNDVNVGCCIASQNEVVEGLFDEMVIGGSGSNEAKRFWEFAAVKHPEWTEEDKQRLWHLNRNMTAQHFWQSHPELDEETKQLLWHARKNKGGNFLDTLGNVAKAVVKSPISKIVAGGLAFVIPPAGLAASAALVAASKVTDAIDQTAKVAAALKSGMPINAAAAKDALIKAKFAKQMVARTAMAAKMGDKDALRGLKALAAAKMAKRQVNPVVSVPPLVSAKKKPQYVVAKGGRIHKAGTKGWKKGSGKNAVQGIFVTPGGRPTKGTFVQ